MEKETKEEVKEQPTKAPGEIQLEDVLETAPVVSQEKTSEKSSVDKKSTEVTTEETKASETAEVKKTEEKPKYSDEDIETWRKDSENKSGWQKSLTKKSQFINKYDDDKIATLEATAKLMENQKEFKSESLPEFFTTKDELGEEVKINSNLLKPHIDSAIESAKKEWVEEYAPQVKDNEKYKAEADQAVMDAANQTALVGIEQYFRDFPDSAFDLGDNPLQTLEDIKKSGNTHPDYKKYLNLGTVAERSKSLKGSMKDAHVDLFGKSEQIKKAEETIKKEQESVQTEKPGQSAKVVTEDEAFNKELGIGTKQKENVFD